MSKCQVINETAVSSFMETVRNNEKGFEFYRLRVDTQYGPVYLYPKYNSREQILLELVNKHIL